MNIKVSSEHMKLVASCLKYFETYPHKEDLFQVGMIGLEKASSNYVDDGRAKFTTYAYKYILGEMYRHVYNDKGIKISPELTKRYFKIEKYKALLQQRLLREPSNKEIAFELGITEEMVTESKMMVGLIISIDEPLNNDNGKEMSYHEVIPVKNNISIEDKMTLEEEIKKLTPLEQKIIYMRYYYDYTQSEIAKHLNMSQVQVSRSETKVKTKLKQGLSA